MVMLLSAEKLLFLLEPNFQNTIPALFELTAGGIIGISFVGGGSCTIPTWQDVVVEEICTIEGGW